MQSNFRILYSSAGHEIYCRQIPAHRSNVRGLFRETNSYWAYQFSAEDMNRKYIDKNGDCEEADNFYPLTAFDESGIVGHLILRYMGAEKKEMRIGFVIVDDTKRGKGYGREMIQLALYRHGVLEGESLIVLNSYKNV